MSEQEQNVVEVRQNGSNYLAQKTDDGSWMVFERAFGPISRNGVVTWESFKIEISEPERTEVLRTAGLVD